MNRVLYEVSSKYDFLTYISFLFLTALFLFLRYKYRYKYDGNKNLNDNKSYKGFIRGFVYLAILLMLCLLSQIDMYNKIVKAYEQGNYQIVEGYVENFEQPYGYGGHKYESFDVNGVPFSYSNFSSPLGYHTEKSHGGVITGNGQHLKIGYVYYNRAWGNVIVYIEKLN